MAKCAYPAGVGLQKQTALRLPVPGIGFRVLGF